jgi:hypothetical protein
MKRSMVNDGDFSASPPCLKCDNMPVGGLADHHFSLIRMWLLVDDPFTRPRKHSTGIPAGDATPIFGI